MCPTQVVGGSTYIKPSVFSSDISIAAIIIGRLDELSHKLFFLLIIPLTATEQRTIDIQVLKKKI